MGEVGWRSYGWMAAKKKLDNREGSHSPPPPPSSFWPPHAVPSEFTKFYWVFPVFST